MGCEEQDASPGNPSPVTMANTNWKGSFASVGGASGDVTMSGRLDRTTDTTGLGHMGCGPSTISRGLIATDRHGVRTYQIHLGSLLNPPNNGKVSAVRTDGKNYRRTKY